MDKTKSVTKTDVVEFSVSPVSVTDAANIADAAVNAALKFAVDKTQLEDTSAVVDRLKWGNSVTYGYFHYGLAKHMAQRVGELDQDVKAVYVWDEDMASEDKPFDGIAEPGPIHLIVWVQRRTNALESLLEALDRALTESYAKLMGARELQHVLDAQIIDDEAVEQRTGYGAMLSSVHYRPIEAWKR